LNAETGGLHEQYVGFVGAGQIGVPMVERLLGAGLRVAVYVRDGDVGRRLVRRGAILVANVGDIAVNAQTVIVCVYSDRQLEEVAPDVIGRLAPGATMVSHTTGSPVLIRRLADQARSRGSDVVDAAFTGTAEDVRAGELTVLLGGNADRCEPVLRCYAGTIVRTGPVGSALTVKLVNNLLFAANAQLAVEMCRLATELGVDRELLLTAVGQSSGSTRALDYLARAGGPEEFARTVAPFLHKDFALCAKVAADLDDASLGLLGEVVRRGPIAISDRDATSHD
jgi:3-hydroxyisobutyrate dehydrogenase-like beta-hydroxyacid dehydrogenase